MPKPKSKKAAKKTAAKKRSAVMTPAEYTSEEEPQQVTQPEVVPPGQPIKTVVPATNVPGEAVQTVPAAIVTTEPNAPRAIDGEVVPHPADLDPHSLVDMRIRHDPRHLGDDAQLMPTTDTNYMYVRLKGKGIPYKEPPKNTEPGEPADTVEATYPAEEEEETKS